MSAAEVRGCPVQAVSDEMSQCADFFAIGSHVWIGSRVSVLKGAIIPDGCIVASNSVVGKVFTEKKLPHRRQSRQSDSTRCELEVRLSDFTFVILRFSALVDILSHDWYLLICK